MVSAWRRTVPAARSEASVIRENERETLGIAKTRLVVKVALRESKEHCWRGIQFHG